MLILYGLAATLGLLTALHLLEGALRQRMYAPICDTPWDCPVVLNATYVAGIVLAALSIAFVSAP